jgi:hypothetical protein
MAKKQTRRSISVNRQLFDQARSLAGEKKVALSQLTEDALRVVLAAQGDPQLASAFDAMLSNAKIQQGAV